LRNRALAVSTIEVVDHYIEFFNFVKVHAPPGVVPTVASTDGVNFDRQPTPEERGHSSPTCEGCRRRSDDTVGHGSDVANRSARGQPSFRDARCAQMSALSSANPPITKTPSSSASSELSA